MDNNNIIKIRKDDPKPAYKDWYEFFKHEIGRYCIDLPGDNEICFENPEIRKQDKQTNWYERSKETQKRKSEFLKDIQK